MQITNNKNKIIYDGQDGFVATFRKIVQNGEPLMKVDCYSPSSLFNASQIQQLLVQTVTHPIGSGYDVVFRPDMESIVFSKGLALGRENTGYFLVITASPKNAGRFVFFTNIAANASSGEDSFHNLAQTLLSSMKAAMQQTASSRPSTIDEDDYDDDDDEYARDAYYDEFEDDDSLYPEVSEEVYALYTGNFLFNLFGDQLLAVVCSSKDEYNRFIAMLRDIDIITAPSLNPDGWNDVTKYIMYDVDRNTAFAVCHLPKTVDAVLPVLDFLAKIYRQSKELLNADK